MGFILVTNLLKLGLNGTGTFVLVFQLNLEFINKIRILPKKKKKKKKKKKQKRLTLYRMQKHGLQVLFGTYNCILCKKTA